MLGSRRRDTTDSRGTTTSMNNRLKTIIVNIMWFAGYQRLCVCYLLGHDVGS